MTSLSEQLSAARQSQWEAQIDMLRTFSTRALDSAEQLIALNMKTSRASMEQATGTFKKILEVSNPRDLYALGSVAQGQWQHMFAYSRELLGIATSARARGWSAQPAAPAASAPAVEPVAAAPFDNAHIAAALDSDIALAEATLQAGIEDLHDAAPVPEVTELDAETAGAAPSETPDAAPVDAPADALADAPPEAPQAAAAPAVLEAAVDMTVAPDAIVDAIVDQALGEATPPSRTKPLAKAMNKLAPRLAGAGHPSALTIPTSHDGEVDMSLVTPLDNPPPPQAQLHAATEPRSSRASRKK